MRFIRTTNNIAEFIETSDKTGKIISSMGFQFGEVYYQIKNGKVTFYLNDQENPFRNDIWTLNIPFVMDGVEYADEDSASAHLYAVFNDRFQEQLDQLKEDLAAELEMSPTHISVLERGVKAPKLETLVKIANTLHVSTDTLLQDVVHYAADGIASELSSAVSRLSKKDQERILNAVRALIE